MISRTSLTKAVMLFAIMGLVACATGPRRETYWVNPSVGLELQQHRFTLDSTECAALANQLIPEPQTGSISLHTPSGPVYGTYETPSRQGYQPDGAVAGMQEVRRKQNRRDYAAACIANRGWQQRERVVGQ